MSRLRWCLAFLVPVLLGTKVLPASAPSALVFTHVTVIDATGTAAKPDMTVVISGRRIAVIGNSAATHIPQDVQVINAAGKYLIPGLWDMHVHWGDTEYLPLFLANGVTGVRIMWGGARQQDWRRQSDSGQLLAPHLVIASAIIDGPKPFWPGSISVSNEAQARQAVVQAKQEGADFVKVYSFLPREEYFAIADESKKQGIPFAGHLPLAVSAEEASSAGQKSFEHLFGLLPACSTRSDEIAKASSADLVDEMAAQQPSFWGEHVRALRQVELDTYSPEKASALFAILKKNGTWQCPTLTLLRSIAYVDDAAFVNDPRVKYMPGWARSEWSPAAAINSFGPRTPEDFAFAKKEFQKDLELVAAMQHAGVGILAGTDTSNPFCIPGFSLHDELGLLVKAGLTPMQALQAATLNPARFLGTEKDFGTIEEGKVADLLLLDANPLEDIGNTRKIASVVYGGRLYSKADLDQMLSQVEAVAGRKPVRDVLMKTINEKGVAAAIQQYYELKSKEPATYDLGENELISVGYQLLHAKRVGDAIEILKLSTEVFPQSYNTWDSLAEAYMDHNDKELAIKNYEKSLTLNPDNANATKKLKELRSP